MLRTISLAAASAVAAALAAGTTMVTPLPAAAAEDVRVRTIDYRDLDLTREAGVRTLERRVRYGVDSVCGDPTGLALGEREMHRTCVRVAAADARRQIDRAVRMAQDLTTAQR